MGRRHHCGKQSKAQIVTDIITEKSGRMKPQEFSYIDRIEYFTVQIIDWSINDNDEDLE